jgi:hypothetical protein
MAMSEHGHTLTEAVFAAATLSTLLALGVPTLRAYTLEAHILGAASVFKQDFLLARSLAVRSGAQTAIRFERRPDGAFVSVYADGNHNGVLSADIDRGIDRRVSGPRRLDTAAPGVRVGINPGVPAPPPDSGMLDTTDPIRFGRSDMLSFSPLGTATPGTFYLAGEGMQAAVRVTGGAGRVRVLVCRGRRWTER